MLVCDTNRPRLRRSGPAGRRGRLLPLGDAVSAARRHKRAEVDRRRNHQRGSRSVTAPRAHARRTMCEALMTTAAERPDQVALRSPDDAFSLTFAQLAAPARRHRVDPPRPRPAQGRRARAHDAQPARVPRRRRGGDAARGDAVQPLQHLAGRADRLRHGRRGQPAGGGRAALRRRRARGRRRRRAGRRARRARRRRRGLRPRAALARGGARGPADADLHLRHHGAAEGRRADPRQHAGRAARRPRRGAAGERRALGLVPALGPRRRPLGLALLGAHDLRPHGDAGGRPDAGLRRRRPGQADRASAASRACGRSSRRRSRPRAPRRWRPSELRASASASTRRAGWPSAPRPRRSRCSSSSPRAACRSARCGA